MPSSWEKSCLWSGRVLGGEGGQGWVLHSVGLGAWVTPPAHSTSLSRVLSPIAAPFCHLPGKLLIILQKVDAGSCWQFWVRPGMLKAKGCNQHKITRPCYAFDVGGACACLCMYMYVCACISLCVCVYVSVCVCVESFQCDC